MRFLTSLLQLWLNLFNPPPLSLLSRVQKVGRVLVVTVALLVTCILAAMVGAVAIFLVQRGSHMLSGVPQLLNGLEIIFISLCVNAVCVAVLLQIRKTDGWLVPPGPADGSSCGGQLTHTRKTHA